MIFASGLREAATGTLRAGRSHVSFETVVEPYEAGASPEDLVARLPSLELPFVYLDFGMTAAPRVRAGGPFRHL